jgi:hypothetical protein
VRERGLDGVICGHIHCAAIRPVDGVVYVNCGDWVDSCTAIVEHHDGRLELVRAWQAAALPAQSAVDAKSIAPVLGDLPPTAIACNEGVIQTR